MNQPATAAELGRPPPQPRLTTRAGDTMRVADALRLAIQIAETAIAVAAREAPGEAARLRHALQKLQRSI